MKGFGKLIGGVLAWSWVLVVVFLMFSCKSAKVVTVEKISHDSVAENHIRIDSVYVYEHDSIFVDRYRSNDTIWLTTEKWSVRYRDREVLVHDSIYIHKQDSIPYAVEYQVEKPVRDGRYTFYCTVTWVVIALLIAWIAWFIFSKTPYGKMASTAIKLWLKM